MKCPKCGKPLKENTDGDDRYCQGHSVFEQGVNTNESKNKRRTM